MTGGDKYQSYHDDLLEMFEEEGLIFNCEFRKKYSNTLKKHNLGHHNSDTSLLKDVKIINEQIKKDNLKIIRGMDEDTGNTCYMLVNRTTTPMSCWESLDVGRRKYHQREKTFLFQIASNILQHEEKKIPNISSISPFKRQLALEDGSLMLMIRHHWLKYDGDCLSLGLCNIKTSLTQ